MKKISQAVLLAMTLSFAAAAPLAHAQTGDNDRDDTSMHGHVTSHHRHHHHANNANTNRDDRDYRGDTHSGRTDNDDHTGADVDTKTNINTGVGINAGAGVNAGAHAH